MLPTLINCMKRKQQKRVWCSRVGQVMQGREVGRRAAGLRSVPAGEPGVCFSAALQFPPHLSIPALCRTLSFHTSHKTSSEAHGGGPTACPPTAAPSLPSLVATPQGGCSFSPNPHPSGESKDGLLGKSRKNEKGPAMQNEQDSECKEWLVHSEERRHRGVMPDSVAQRRRRGGDGAEHAGPRRTSQDLAGPHRQQELRRYSKFNGM